MSTTLVGNPATLVDVSTGLDGDPTPGPSVITAMPSPYWSTQPLATSIGSDAPEPDSPAALARNLMSSSLALTMPCRWPSTRSHG